MTNQDAKLKAAARKRLPDSAFCGPDQSYPAHDRAHAINALARVKQHGSPALQSRVKACVCRKYPSLPACKTGSKDWEAIDINASWPKELLDELETIKDKPVAEDVLLADINDYLEEIEKDYSADAIRNNNKILNDKINELTEKNEALEDKVKSLESENGRLVEDNTSLRADQHRVLVDKLFDLQKQLNKPAVTALADDEAVKAYKETLNKRTDESLRDAIGDLEVEVPGVKEPEQKVGPTADDVQTDSDNKDDDKGDTKVVDKETKRREKISNLFYPKEDK